MDGRAYFLVSITEKKTERSYKEIAALRFLYLDADAIQIDV